MAYEKGPKMTLKQYSQLTQERFDELVFELAREDGVDAVLTIPGVWEEVSEYYNNAALDRWQREQQEEKTNADH
jgi:hypothetical protein